MSIKCNLLKLTITAFVLSTCVAPSLAESNRSDQLMWSDLQVAGLDDMFNTIKKQVENSVQEKISKTMDDVMPPAAPPAPDKKEESAPHSASSTTSSEGSAYLQYIKAYRDGIEYCTGGKGNSFYPYLSAEKKKQFAAMRAYLVHENKLQQFPRMTKEEKKQMQTYFKNNPPPKVSPAEQKAYALREARACEALINPLASGYDKPPSNNKFQAEANEVRKLCESNLTYKDAYDCSCLEDKALEYKTQNPYVEIKQEGIVSSVGKQCPNYKSMRPKFLHQCESSVYVNNLNGVPKGPLCECTADGTVERVKEKVGQTIQYSEQSKMYNEAMAQCIQKLR